MGFKTANREHFPYIRNALLMNRESFPLECSVVWYKESIRKVVSNTYFKNAEFNTLRTYLINFKLKSTRAPYHKVYNNFSPIEIFGIPDYSFKLAILLNRFCRC